MWERTRESACSAYWESDPTIVCSTSERQVSSSLTKPAGTSRVAVSEGERSPRFNGEFRGESLGWPVVVVVVVDVVVGGGGATTMACGEPGGPEPVREMDVLRGRGERLSESCCAGAPSSSASAASSSASAPTKSWPPGCPPSGRLVDERGAAAAADASVIVTVNTSPGLMPSGTITSVVSPSLPGTCAKRLRSGYSSKHHGSCTGKYRRFTVKCAWMGQRF